MTKSDEEDKKALAIAIMIWNLSLSPEEVQAEHRDDIDKMLGMSDEQNHGYQQFKEVVDFMLERKKN